MTLELVRISAEPRKKKTVMALCRAYSSVTCHVSLQARRLSVSAIRLDLVFEFSVAAAWHGKPAAPAPPSTRTLRTLKSTSPIYKWREELLTTLQPRRSFGDDALFYTATADEGSLSVGVADGVGGWSEQGVDPSAFSTALMYHARQLASMWSLTAQDDAATLSDPRHLLAKAYELVLLDKDVLAGSSTACLAHLDSTTGNLDVANLGDSSFYVLRQGKCVHMQPAQTHYFNCPLQLSKGGGQGSYSDSPMSADLVQAHLQHMDLVVLATDGFTDNVWPNELERLLEISDDMSEKDNLQHFVDAASEYARLCSFKEDRRSPFEAEAARHGYRAPGGKVDDVTVLAVLCKER